MPSVHVALLEQGLDEHSSISIIMTYEVTKSWRLVIRLAIADTSMMNIMNIENELI